MKISKWLGIYSKTNNGSGGYGETLRWVPPVYPQGSARLAVGFAINHSNKPKSHQQQLVKHIESNLKSFQKCVRCYGKSNTQACHKYMM